MSSTETGQLTRSAADIYDEFFLPALFLDWPPQVAAAAGLAPGQAVLDVACGTGALTREAATRVAPGGRVTGLDCNEGMLAVARRKAPEIDWHQGFAETLPYDDGAFDAVVSQFGLMFFTDRAAAMREMWRVLKPGGRLAVAVWASLDDTPGYAAMTALLDRLFGAEIAEALRAPYELGAPESLRALIAEAGIRTLDGSARFPSIRSWVETDIKGWTLADALDDAQFQRLQRAAEREFGGFVQADGSVRFAAPAHIVSAVKH